MHAHRRTTRHPRLGPWPRHHPRLRHRSRRLVSRARDRRHRYQQRSACHPDGSARCRRRPRHANGGGVHRRRPRWAPSRHRRRVLALAPALPPVGPPARQNLEGVFSLLNNVVWTSHGPCAVDGFELTRARLRARGPVTVYGIDKFPRMVDYVIPSGVRIADADRVRLGAHLASGTTVMHEGFVNFNAGTLGESMVEGRISAGVVVGTGSDVGGGASIMGTLSGGGSEIISIGAGCLLGANSGIGISLGDGCVVEAGCYVTAGTKIGLPDQRVVKAREISGADGLLFRRNSVTGAVEAVARSGSWGTLNTVLHAN